MEPEENSVLWSGVLEKKGTWTSLRRWRAKRVTITPHSVLVVNPSGIKGQKLIVKSQIVDVHYSDLAEDPLRLDIVLPVGSMRFRCRTVEERDAVAALLKPAMTSRRSTDRTKGVSLESFVRVHVGSKTLLLQKLVLRKYSRLLFKSFHGLKHASESLPAILDSQQSTVSGSNLADM